MRVHELIGCNVIPAHGFSLIRLPLFDGRRPATPCEVGIVMGGLGGGPSVGGETGFELGSS